LTRLRIALATAAITVTMAQIAAAAGPATTATTTTTTTTAEAPPPPPPPDDAAQSPGITVVPTPAPQPAPTNPKPPKTGGQETGAGNGPGGNQKPEGDKNKGKAENKEQKGAKKDSNGGAVAPDFGGLTAPVYPSVTCGSVAAPVELLPIYQRASDTYGLGPQGPAILAAINGIESGFGANLGPSSAGAVGWMQFLPSSWATYGVDADGDGKADPNDPQDAIFAAASYLQAAGMPADTAGAIFAYNHADWYVAEVLANAGCYGTFDGTFSLTPGKPVISCAPAKGEFISDRYMHAFEEAAGRYDLGRRGVWALAGVAKLESNFGLAMNKAQMRQTGPLGLDRDEWNRFEVDGDGDGLIRRATIEDSAATLAREIWSRGGLRSGLFLHNQAEWYVEQALNQGNQVAGHCQTRTVEWNLALPTPSSAPINWANLSLSNGLEMHDIQSGALDPRIMSLLGMVTQTHRITVAALRSDHSEFTSEGNVSNHFYGRAVDIAAVDGISCTDVAPTSPCGQLGRTLTLLPAPIHPTELIYCFDLDGPGPAFARSDHCDHIHAGYDG
jgi:transglycosylase-like protein with SLT domain